MSSNTPLVNKTDLLLEFKNRNRNNNKPNNNNTTTRESSSSNTSTFPYITKKELVKHILIIKLNHKIHMLKY